MSSLPKVRWLALVLAVAFGVVFAGVNFDLKAAVGDLGTQAAGVATALLAVAKVIREAMASIDAQDPMVWIQDGHIVRGVETPGFWRRVL